MTNDRWIRWTVASVLLILGCPNDDDGDPDPGASAGTTDDSPDPPDPTGADDDANDPAPPVDDTTPMPPPGDPSDDGDDPPSDDGDDPPSDDGVDTDDPPPSDDAPPPRWTCPPDFYGTLDGCDCGCGTPDPDCADATPSSCEFCDACSPFASDCSTIVDPNDNALCTVGECGNQTLEGGEVCDGAGTLPPGFDCEAFGFTGGVLGCAADCGNLDISTCTGGPEGWTCVPEYYAANDGCDCGCGIVDPDCADAMATACDFCDVLGSCVAPGEDCGALDPNDNATCL